MIDINELRRLAEDQRWIGRWYDAGCETLMAERDGEHEEVAHPVPIGLVPYLVAVQPAAISELLDRLEAAEKELVELRLGVSKQQSLTDAAQQLAEAAQRRADKLSARAEASEKERDALRAENAALIDDMNLLRNNNMALRAKIAEMERQEPK